MTGLLLSKCTCSSFFLNNYWPGESRDLYWENSTHLDTDILINDRFYAMYGR